tara:strand:- start:319 stop:864 length:546 start_codon:yes stop_codon:yes gene_type:complete
MNTSEYDVAYATKEWLIKNGWTIIAFDPPGAQGTFSIPNPSKKKEGEKGQTGTTAPDIIAVKCDMILIVECKGSGKAKILSDGEKLKNFLTDDARINVFKQIMEAACEANGVALKFDESNIILAKAHGGKDELLDPELETFHVKIEGAWDATNIDVKADLSKTIKVTYLQTSDERKKILED